MSRLPGRLLPTLVIAAWALATPGPGRSETRLGARPLGLMTATEVELEPFLAAVPERGAETVAGRRFVRGLVDGREVVMVVGGVGKVNAALTATLLIERFQVAALVFSGVGAGIDPELGLGDVVVSERTVQSDAVRIAGGSATPLPIKRLDHDGPHKSGEVRPPKVLLDLALAAARESDLQSVLPMGGSKPRARPGTICTGDAFVTDPRHLRWIQKTHSGAVYEMEGGAMAQVARASGTPWIVLRGVSDHANGLNAVVYPLTRGKAARNAALVALNLIGRLQGF